MPSYKLIYFCGRGRGEVVRYIFVQAGIGYEDKRVSGEEFMKMKPDLPAGSLPVLEVDGVQLAGSGSIARFLGERFGLAGANDFENAQLDSIVDVLRDLTNVVTPAFFGKDEAKKEAAKKELFETHIPKYFGVLEKRIVTNNSSDGWAYGNKLTYVDLQISLMMDMLTAVEPSLGEKYSALCKLNEAVKAQPKIAEWIKNRPDSPF